MLNREQISDVELKNLVLSKSDDESMNSKLSWLIEVMPADSTVNASVRKIGAKYLCKVDVVSSIGCFRGEAFESVPQVAVDSAINDVKLAAKSSTKSRLGLDGTSFVALMTELMAN